MDVRGPRLAIPPTCIRMAQWIGIPTGLWTRSRRLRLVGDHLDRFLLEQGFLEFDLRVGNEPLRHESGPSGRKIHESQPRSGQLPGNERHELAISDDATDENVGEGALLPDDTVDRSR